MIKDKDSNILYKLDHMNIKIKNDTQLGFLTKAEMRKSIIKQT